MSTPYLYARELLCDERGIIVPFGDAGSMAAALVTLASNDAYRLAMAQRAYRLGRGMTWPVVGKAYAELADEMYRSSWPLARADL